MKHGTPEAEVTIDTKLVRALLRRQHPDLASLPLEPADSGWDNVLYRLGEDLAVRLPRREVAARLALHEQTWLPQLAARLPIPIAAPLRVGAPTDGYPWPWSIVPWLPGSTADQDPLRRDQAPRLAEFLVALHQPAPDDAPPNLLRGVPLRQRSSKLEERLEGLGSPSGVSPSLISRLRALWQRALDVPDATTACWLHGDLHPRNILVEQGILTGIIDWGDVTSGDPATDLATTWMLFDSVEARQELLDRYGASPALILRAKGWAVFFGVVLLSSGLVDHPAHAAIGRATLERLLSED